MHEQFNYKGHKIEDCITLADPENYRNIARYAKARLGRTFLADRFIENPPEELDRIECLLIDGKNVARLPDWLKKLPKLSYLSLPFHLLPKSGEGSLPEDLETLEVSGEAPLIRLEGLYHLSLVRIVSWDARLVVPLQNFPKLEHLHVSFDRRLALLQEMQNSGRALVSASFMPLRSALELKSINPEKLRYARIIGGHLVSLDGIANLSEVSNLSLKNLPKLNSLSVLRSLPKLKELSIGYCPRVADYHLLAEMENIERLIIYGCGRATVDLKARLQGRKFLELGIP